MSAPRKEHALQVLPFHLKKTPLAVYNLFEHFPSDSKQNWFLTQRYFISQVQQSLSSLSW